METGAEAEEEEEGFDTFDAATGQSANMPSPNESFSKPGSSSNKRGGSLQLAPIASGGTCTSLSNSVAGSAHGSLYQSRDWTYRGWLSLPRGLPHHVAKDLPSDQAH